MEIREPRCNCLIVRRRCRDAHHEVVAVEDLRDNPRKCRLHLLMACCEIVLECAQEIVERQTADLSIATRGHQIARNARGNNLIRRTLERELHTRLFLVHNLADALCAREIALRHDLCEQIEKARQIFLQHLRA